MDENILDEIFKPLSDGGYHNNSDDKTRSTCYDCKRIDKAKRQIQALIEQQVLIGQKVELKSFIESLCHYPPDHAYEHESFRTVPDSYYEDRVAELTDQITTLKAQLKK